MLTTQWLCEEDFSELGAQRTHEHCSVSESRPFACVCSNSGSPVAGECCSKFLLLSVHHIGNSKRCVWGQSMGLRSSGLTLSWGQ